jgi:hypothetical protein
MITMSLNLRMASLGTMTNCVEAELEVSEDEQVPPASNLTVASFLLPKTGAIALAVTRKESGLLSYFRKRL